MLWSTIRFHIDMWLLSVAGEVEFTRNKFRKKSKQTHKHVVFECVLCLLYIPVLWLRVASCRREAELNQKRRLAHDMGTGWSGGGGTYVCYFVPLTSWNLGWMQMDLSYSDVRVSYPRWFSLAHLPAIYLCKASEAVDVFEVEPV